jgi:predicted amidohydrolase
MEFTLGLAQCRHAENGDAVALVRRWAQRAKDAGVDLLVFPESLMSRYEMERGAFLAASQPVGGAFSQAVEGIAAQTGLWIAYTMNERAETCSPTAGPAACDAAAVPSHDSGSDESPKPPYNTAILVDDQGRRRMVYRKVHLFDTDFTQESSRMSAGDALADPVWTPFGCVGVAICYDLRFPEVARRAALLGCDLMLYPAAWVAGEGKVLQWKTLLAARAIENQMFVAGLSRSDEGYIGCSCVFDPSGNVLAEAGKGEELLTCPLDVAVLAQARTNMPVLRHRRPQVYGESMC